MSSTHVDSSPARASSSSSSSAGPPEDAERVRCMKLRQQDLWAFKPVWSVRFVITMYIILATILIPVGIAVLIQSLRMVETDHVRYDNLPNCTVGDTSSNDTNQICTFPITISERVEPPSYFYYGLVNFYQNQRNYIKSRSFDQLRGEDDPSDLGDCDPLEEDADGNTLVPCGLTANSFFNDSFVLCRTEECAPEDQIDITDEDIAWEIDRTSRFKARDGNTPEQNRLITSQDFMVWMRLATYGTFHKLYRIINEPLEADTYWVRANASFPVQSFDGEKFVFISETKWFGGRNRFIGYSYIVVGAICLLLATAFFLRKMKVQRRSDVDDLDLQHELEDAPRDSGQVRS